MSALDAKIRIALRDDLRALQRKLGITAIFVTHDQEEALALSDRVVVMTAGKVDQIGTPADIYSRPATPFVATFVGAMNVLDCDVIDADEGRVQLHGQALCLAGPAAANGRLRVGVRPEAMTITALAGGNQLNGTVEDMTFLGPILRLRARVGETAIRLDLFGAARTSPPAIGDTVAIWFSHESVVPLG